MAIIGFLALLVVGLYFFVAGVILQWASLGFSDKSSGVASLLLIIGSGVLYAAYVNCPFSIMMK